MIKHHDTFYNSVIQVNNMIPLDNHNLKERITFTHNTYPKQKTEYLNTKIRLRYFDEYEGKGIHNRFWINGIKYPDARKHYEQLKAVYFVILRWDTEYPFRAILMNNRGEVIVANSTELESMVFPPDYTETQSSAFSNLKETIFDKLDNMDEFIGIVDTEHIYKYPIQNQGYLGCSVYTEYYNDIKDKTLENKLQPTPFKKWKAPVKQLTPDEEMEKAMRNFDFGMDGRDRFGSILVPTTKYDFGFEETDTVDSTLEEFRAYDFGMMKENKVTTIDDYGFDDQDTYYFLDKNTFVLDDMGDMDRDTFINPDLAEKHYYGITIIDDSGEETIIDDGKEEKVEITAIYPELLAGNEKLIYKPEYMLRGYPYFFDRHRMNMVDKPRKAINQGIVLRADRDSNNGQIVVMEMVDGELRFVTDKEAYFYTSTTMLQLDKHIKPVDFYNYMNDYNKESTVQNA